MSHNQIVRQQRFQQYRQADATEHPNHQPRSRGTDTQLTQPDSMRAVNHELKQIAKVMGLSPTDSRVVSVLRARI
ncbi:MAG: hypothetical protein V4534_01350 [Myxococcota bacterium]